MAGIIEYQSGNRFLSTAVGPYNIKVWEIPAANLNHNQWGTIQKARQSYFTLWGTDADNDVLEDSFDLQPDYPNFETTHYIAAVFDGKGIRKVLTQRKISLDLETPPIHLPEDLTFWVIRDRISKQKTPLTKVVRDRYPRLATISRACSFNARVDKTGVRNDTTALAFAATQLLLTDMDSPDTYMCQLCPEVRDVALSIQDLNIKPMTLDFTPSDQILGLSNRYALELDNTNPQVRDNKLKFPGYWINNDDAFAVLSGAIKGRNILPEELQPSVYEVLKDPRIRAKSLQADLFREGLTHPVTGASLLDGYPSDHNEGNITSRILKLLTRPRYFKYLLPLVNSSRNLQDALVNQTRDGPFSSLLLPARWRESNENLLDVARMKYGQGFQPS